MNPSTKKEARRKLRDSISKALEPFDLHGLGVYLPNAQIAIMKAIEKYVKEVKDE